MSKMKGSVIEIDYQTAVSFLLPKHYSGRVPTISKAFGWYDCQTYTTEHLKTGYVFYTQKYLKGEDTKYIAICINCSYLFIKDEYSMTTLNSEE